MVASMLPVYLFRISLCGLILALWTQTSGATEPYHHGEPSDLEQLLLERINETRANPGPTATRLGIKLNDQSTRQPLVFQSALIEASEAHSDYLIAKNKFSHIGLGNTNAQQRMRSAGYPFGGGYEGWAENLGLHETTGYTEEGVLHRTQDLIFRSAEHRQWLLQPFFREIGLGVVFGRSNIQGANRHVIVITEKFAASGASPSESEDGSFLQGVVYDDANSNGRYDVGEGVPDIRITPDTGGTYHGVTSSSGGYAVPMADHQGAVTLTFAGESFSHTINTSMTTGQNAKADLRTQEVPVPVIIAPPVASDPPMVEGPLLEISRTTDANITLSIPNETDSETSMVLLHSLDLKTWSAVDMPSDGSVELETLHRQGYYRLAPQS